MLPTLGPSDSTIFTNLDWFIDMLPAIGVGFQKFVGFVTALSFPISLMFVIGIIYCVERLKQIRHAEHLKYDIVKVEPAFEDDDETGDVVLARRWDTVMRHIASDNPNDWKNAIIEADIMLDEMLTKLGYRGETVGEKLKRVVTGDMKARQDAWDAHLVRNDIAHRGSSFQLTKIEADRTIGLYKKVFEEFYFI